MNKVKQVYIPYWEWEDFKCGMWRNLDKLEEEVFLRKAIEFTGNHILYGKAMIDVSLAWPRTMLNSLTNHNINRRAFLGHCACQYAKNIPEYITRMAWKELNDKQRFLADKVAQKTIDNWMINYVENEKQNTGIHKSMGKQMLFKWDS